MAKSLRDMRYRAIVDKLVAHRKAAGLTQRELADRIGRVQSFVAKAELCERRLDVIELMDVLEGLEVDPAKFLAEFLPAKRKTAGR